MGRVRTPVERRRSLLEEFDKSGLSGAKFAEISGVKYSTLAYWLQKRRRERREGNPAKEPVGSAKSMRWLEAVIEQAHSPGAKESCGLVLELPGGARVPINHFSQVALAAALLAALEKPAMTC